jgi:hypothetical protein
MQPSNAPHGTISNTIADTGIADPGQKISDLLRKMATGEAELAPPPSPVAEN